MDNFSFIANADVAAIESLHQQYLQDSNSVDVSWQQFFKGFDFSQKWSGGGQSTANVTAEHTRKEMEVVHLIRGYRSRGHLLAKTNPIGERRYKNEAELELKDFNLTDADLDTAFEAGVEVFGRAATLREIVEALKKIYVSRIGFEYLYIRDRKAKSWLRRKIESEYLNFNPENAQKKRILEKLNSAVAFENFIHTKYLGKKRFSLEGGESTIAGLDAAINRGADLGVEEVVIGMAHRGRLNVLTNILQKPYEQVFNEFEENVELQDFSDGDVKYHMGYSSQIKTPTNKDVRMTLMANPSHLEAVNPVVEGFSRAIADEHYNHIEGQDKYDPVLPILIHGDAAVAGQGIVYEVTQMSNLPAYYTGGTLHFIINNQVGFTTDDKDARSSIYCSDIAKIVDAPIFHVSGDDPEAVVYVMQLAAEFRQEFNRDVFVDMVCYRKYGHNEADEPKFTQPTMYNIINKHDNPRDIYLRELKEKGELDAAFFEEVKAKFEENLQKLLNQVKQKEIKYEFAKLEKQWKLLRVSKPEDFEVSPNTAISKEAIAEVAKALTTIPDGFKPIKQIAKVLETRQDIFAGKKPFDWAAGELLAYGSILAEGKVVRLTGQDVQRGTFSHRHAVIHDVENNNVHNNLAYISDKQGKFEIHNSFLSEYAVLGFEFGYALANPEALVLWEAQFGDFSNGAQIIIDQFIAAAESKWTQMNGLVLLLPHGYEGQGPEHSNARPERYLQLCADYNMYVCVCSTPANLFHMMRRQLALPFRKPCVHLSPKSMLRSAAAVSPMEDFTNGKFQEVIGDSTVKANKVKKVLLCCGKIYYELDDYRTKNKREDVAIVRVEQLHPFPKTQVEAELAKYKNATAVWVQEEPENMGYWGYVLRQFPQIGIANKVLREAAASPSTGYLKIHTKEQAELIERAFK